MILSDRDIKKAFGTGKIIIRPTPDWQKQLGSCSVDLHLGAQDNATKITINPGQFILGITEEHVELPDDLCGILHGKSSLGRKGLMIHSTAPLIDAGFRGKIVLELYNCGPSPIGLTTGMSICALSFETLTSPAEVPYFKKKTALYLNQKTP